jgi:hypothetical protein
VERGNDGMTGVRYLIFFLGEALLNGVPLVALLETRETDTRNVVLFGGKKAFERLREPNCQHLDGCGRHVFALALENRFQIILTWKCPFVLILCLDRLKHLVIDQARLDQALYEQAGLFFIWVQTVLECFHRYILLRFIRICPVPPVGGRPFIPIAEARGPLAANR